jgi:hypothetical protein
MPAVFQLLSEDPHYSMQVEIEQLIYTLRLFFDDDGYWYLTILDESGTIIYRAGRRVLPIGEWLVVDEAERITIAQLRNTYDLASGFFPGMLLAVSSAPLALEQADADLIHLDYLTAAELAAAVPS